MKGQSFNAVLNAHDQIPHYLKNKSQVDYLFTFASLAQQGIRPFSGKLLEKLAQVYNYTHSFEIPWELAANIVLV